MNSIKSMKYMAAAITLLGCAAAGSAQAQSTTAGVNNYNPSWYILPSVNGINPDSKFGTESHGAGVGLRLGKPVSPMWDIQFGTTFSRARDDSANYRQNTLGADALYIFSRSSFRPFLLAGGGAEYDKASTPGSNINRTSPYLNAGLGFQYLFNSQWGMQADVRHAVNFLRGDSFGFDRAHHNIVTVGMIYAFDKPAPPVRIVRDEPPPAPVAPAPVVAQRPEPVAPPPPARFERYTLSSTELFDFDNATLRGSQPKLDEISGVLSRDTSITSVNIIGYTDRLGSDKYNQKLSQRRAEAVKGYLANKGIDSSRLNAVGKGESNPVVECSDKKRTDLIKCLEPNRRVEVEQFVIERRVQ